MLGELREKLMFDWRGESENDLLGWLGDEAVAEEGGAAISYYVVNKTVQKNQKLYI